MLANALDIGFRMKCRTFLLIKKNFDIFVAQWDTETRLTSSVTLTIVAFLNWRSELTCEVLFEISGTL